MLCGGNKTIKRGDIMKEIVKNMTEEWGMTNMDWMGYTLEENEYFSFHHLIVPKRFGGKQTEENGAILIKQASHDYLHVIERTERKLFEEITWVLREINEQRYMPTKEQLQRIRQVLEYFENRYMNMYTREGKPLIKYRYLRRYYD